MNLDEIKQILELAREHHLAELEVEQDGLKIRIRKDAGGHQATVVMASGDAPNGEANTSSAGSAAAGARAASGLEPVPAAARDDFASEPEPVELAVVKAPIVGTFYRAAEPGARSFVEIGDSVKKGQVLCIIEAMKLMNEIESEYEGEVVTAYIENGQPVQYGERLFAIRTS
jgi:acetyl-CoA carboxylase biotin carboxyl carrier protein